MDTRPPEPASWRDEEIDPDATARELREQLARAKARMREHREQMFAAGLTYMSDPDPAGG